MYHIYTTPAFILKVLHQGDADAYVVLFTRDLGRIGASVRGYRKFVSKHRMGLQPYSQVRISIVRGKSGWRITGCENSCHYWTLSNQPREAVFRILQLVERLVHGEEANEELYEVLDAGIRDMFEGGIHNDLLEMAEIVLVARILAVLGYQPRLQDTSLLETSNRDLHLLLEHRNELVGAINKALRASHL